jgi:hypothetical protein
MCALSSANHGLRQTWGVLEEELKGGVANAGAVTRVGEHVLRPSNAHTESIHRLLWSLFAAGFEGVPRPVGVVADGRERLKFLEGEVPLAPYPDWAQADGTLASIAQLLRRFHDASRGYAAVGSTWSEEMADPIGGPIICHNDVCLQNVVFHNGVAVALLDFDFAAPGRATHDVAQFARLCVPIDDDANAARFGWKPADRPTRLRLVADTYGLDAPERHEFLQILTHSIDRGDEFVRRRVKMGDPNFIQAWEEMGGMERFDRRRRW